MLNEEGIYRLYDLQGDYIQHSLGADAGETGIIDARIYENGLVAMTGALPGTSIGLLEIKGWSGAKPISLASPGLTEPPHAWAIVPPDVFVSRHVEVLLATEASTLR